MNPMLPESAVPTRMAAAVFQAKACLLRAQRSVKNTVQGLRRHVQEDDASFCVLVAESVTPLWSDTNPSELWYQQGKIQNLRMAAKRLDRCVLPAGAVFSFWKQTGRASARSGYVRGRMLQEGCMIPAMGGGLCQLSNGLYQTALDAGCQILERHAHSRIVPGSATAAGRDATVAWNYIDLRFRAERDLQLRVRMNASSLSVAVLARETTKPLQQMQASEMPAILIGNDHACESCGEVTCFRHEGKPLQLLHGRARAAFLISEMWPEFENIVEQRGKSNLLIQPHPVLLDKILRSLRGRHFGTGRQANILHAAESASKQLAQKLTPEIDEIFVSQAFLPFLWRAGVLGGRRVHVLMTQPPMRAMQSALNHAFAAHPESPTLGDFRAPEWLVEAEEEALASAEQIITPHALAASAFAAKTKLLEWNTPAREAHKQTARGVVLFPCSTLGRKGAYEVREAVRELGVKVQICGREFEGAGFWDGVDVVRVEPPDWSAINVVVLPAITESQPRMLLQALSLGVPVIATAETGLHRDSGAVFVPMLDARALRSALERVLAD